MSRIAYRDIEFVQTISAEQMAAVYGAGLLNFVQNNWKDTLKGVFQLVPINKTFNFSGFTIGVQVNGQGLSISGSKGGFNFAFGYLW